MKKEAGTFLAFSAGEAEGGALFHINPRLGVLKDESHLIIDHQTIFIPVAVITHDRVLRLLRVVETQAVADLVRERADVLFGTLETLGAHRDFTTRDRAA